MKKTVIPTRKLLSLVQPQLITEQKHTITFMAQGVLPLNLHIIQWSVVSGQWSVVSGQWSVVSGQWSVVSGQWSVVSSQLLIPNPQSPNLTFWREPQLRAACKI